MRRQSRLWGVAATTSALLISSSFGMAAAAIAAPPTGQSDLTPAQNKAKVHDTPTGTEAKGAAVSGPVMVILADQITGTPSSPGNSDKRRSAAKSLQSQIISSTGIDEKTVKHFSLLNAFSASITPAQSQKLASDPRVKAVVADSSVKAPATDPAKTQGPASVQTPQGKNAQTAPDGASPKATTQNNQICPVDPQKPLLEPEALSVIKAASDTGQKSAHDISTGKGVKVAVMAEGIDPQAPDYLRADGTSAIVDYQNFSGAPDSAVQYGDEIFGDASSIAAQGRVVHDLSKFVHISHALPENCNIRIKGVAPDASIVALNILGGGANGGPQPSFAIASNVVQAIDYAVTVQHVDVISESIGAISIPDQGTRNAVQQFNDAAVAQGVTVVASTGDAGVTGTIGNPAADPLVIGTAATTTLRAYQQIGYNGTLLSLNGKWLNGNIASFSSGGFGNAGNLPVIAAPGDSGWAACTDKTDKPGCTDNNGNPSSIELFGGTSQSAPFVAATAALVIQSYKDSHQGIAPSPADIRKILTGTATNLGAPGPQQGAGQVDALAAVTLARTFNSSRGAGTKSITVDQDQIQVEGSANQNVTKTVTVTNNSSTATTIRPELKKLQAISPAIIGTTNIDANGPAFLNAGGVKTIYKQVKVTIPAKTDQFTFQFSYGPKAGEADPGNLSTINASLISPSGEYAGNTRTQGGTGFLGGPDYGRFDIVKPAAGEWTIVFASSPSTRARLFKDPITTVPNTGTIDYRVTPNRWVSTGTISAGSVSLKPFGTAAFTFTTQLPTASGDSTTTLDLGAVSSFTTPSVPVSQRVVVSLDPVTGGSFSGSMTGGNGRGASPASQETYALNVPGGKHAMQVRVSFPAAYTPQSVRVGLVDPTGSLQTFQNNTVDASTGSALLNVVEPMAGQWRVVVWQLISTLGRQIETPYTGRVTFDTTGVTSLSLSRMSPKSSMLTTIASGKETEVAVAITNKSTTDGSYVIDPRTTELNAISYPGQKLTMPTGPLDIFGNLLVPPQTNRVDVGIAAPVGVQALIAEPGSNPVLGGINAVGSAAHPINGVAQSTATLSTRGGQLAISNYTTYAGSVGPFGPEGAPHAQADVAPVIYTAGFDTAAYTDGGDPYLAAAQGTSLDGIQAVVIKAGETKTVRIKINPLAAVGSTVQGRINVVRLGNEGLAALLIPQIAATDQVIDAFDYQYKVGPALPQIAGKVTDDAGAPLSGVKVSALDSTGAKVQTQVSDARGNYAIGGLLGSQGYSICFDASGLPAATAAASACYRDVPWVGGPAPSGTTTVKAGTPGVPVTGINQSLTRSRSVSGTVLDNKGNPVSSVLVYRTLPNGTLDQTNVVLTDASGRYSFKDVDAHTVICAETFATAANPAYPTGLVSECGGVPWGRDNSGGYPANAAKIAVSATSNATLYDIHLKAGVTISGTVTAPDGKPAAGYSTVAFTKDGLFFGGGLSSTQTDGTYRIGGLPSTPLGVCTVSPTGTAMTCAPNVAYTGAGNPLPDGTSLVTPTLQNPVTGLNIQASAASAGSSAANATPALTQLRALLAQLKAVTQHQAG